MLFCSLCHLSQGYNQMFNMAELIQFRGKKEVIDKLGRLDARIRRGEPIFAIDRDADIRSLPPMLAIYGGQCVAGPSANNDNSSLNPFNILADVACLISEPWVVDKKVFYANIGLAIAGDRKLLERFFKQNKKFLPRIRHVEMREFQETAMVYVPDEIYVGREQVVPALRKELSDMVYIPTLEKT